jgi:hypothetical protein
MMFGFIDYATAPMSAEAKATVIGDPAHGAEPAGRRNLRRRILAAARQQRFERRNRADDHRGYRAGGVGIPWWTPVSYHYGVGVDQQNAERSASVRCGSCIGSMLIDEG